MNIWKWLSLTLIVLNLGFFLWLFIVLSGDYQDTPSTTATEEEINEDELYAVLPNHTVETLINDYLSEADENNIDVDITTEDITLHSTNDILGMQVETAFNITPIIDDEEIIFQISDIDVGRLPLSQDALYSLISRASTLPEGIYFSDAEHAMILDTSMFESELAEQFKIKKIDYANNEWYFSIEK